MNVQELFNLGIQFHAEGRTETAMEIWNKVNGIDPNFSAVYLNQHNIYRTQGNLFKARECLVKFLNCPVTGMSLDAIPSIKAQIAEIDRQLNPQLQPVQPNK